jgi:Spy/CpxP family protein refolding chaperone
MKIRTLALTLAVAAGSLAAVGCSGTDQKQPQTSASAATKAPIGQNTHGVVKLVGEALGEVSLRPDQRAELEKLAQAAEARHAAMVDGRKELMTALADQVEKGAIDRAALQPKIERLVADHDKVRPEDAAALAKMHQLLDADQRNAFVDALEAKLHEGMKHGRHGETGAHHERGFARMKQLADDLKLTDEQRDQIKAVLKEAHAAGRHEHMGEIRAKMMQGRKGLEAFRTDKFDPNAVAPAMQGGARERLAEGTGKMLGVAEKVLPILTPEQRKIAADKLRQMAQSGEMGPFGH